jgi:hypothetical protein
MSGETTADGGPGDVVRRLNEAWRTGRFERMPALFHEQAVIVDAAHQPLAQGRTACVESYRGFVASAAVEEYAEEAPTIARFEGTAVVSYPFRIRYTIGGQSYHETGSDCLVLTHAPSGWLIVWRQLVWRAA